MHLYFLPLTVCVAVPTVCQVDYSGGDDPLAASADDSTAVSTSKLDPRIQDLMRVFFDVQAIKKTLLSMEIG